MENQLILQLITTITLYCTGPGAIPYNIQKPPQTECFQKIWECGHKVSKAIAIVAETHNCIGDHITGKLK